MGCGLRWGYTIIEPFLGFKYSHATRTSSAFAVTVAARALCVTNANSPKYPPSLIVVT